VGGEEEPAYGQADSPVKQNRPVRMEAMDTTKGI
jgi:hypothetical protein